MNVFRARSVVPCVALLVLAVASMAHRPTAAHAQAGVGSPETEHAKDAHPGVTVHYLEIVTPSVNETCEALARAHGVVFGDPVPGLGNARTAGLAHGGMIGVRAPLRGNEPPVVRPYVLVDDIEAAVAAARAAGAEIALPPMQLPGGHGTCSIYILGGIEHGLWQL